MKQHKGLPQRSLHIAVKKREAQRIDVENQRMMDRLLMSKGQLNLGNLKERDHKTSLYKARRR
jgi:hypothetical protein